MVGPNKKDVKVEMEISVEKLRGLKKGNKIIPDFKKEFKQKKK